MKHKSSTEPQLAQSSGFLRILSSIKVKILLLLLGAVVAFGGCATFLSYKYYRSTSLEHHKLMGTAASGLVASEIDPERVDSYIKDGEHAKGYLATKKKLEIIKSSSSNIEYVYVYRILPEGCQVVFDLDTEENNLSKPGAMVPFDKSFMKYVPALLKGEKIEPVESDDTYGWLLTVYTPVYDANGQCQCYAAVDISMHDLERDSEKFLFTLAQIMGLILLAVLAVAYEWARRIIRPINDMAETTGSFVFDDEGTMEKNLSNIRSLNIRTRDELENLFHSFVTMTDNSVRYVKDLNSKNAMIQKMHRALLITVADMVENRDENTGQHIRKTAEYVKIILEEMKKRGIYEDQLTEEFMASVVQSAPLHDVGKISVSDVILNKPGKLTDSEFAIMKGHTTAGGKIIDSIIKLMPSAGYLAEAKNLAMYHHEKWNGKGYPCGLAGEDIPLSARVMAVADVFDALVSRRSYKAGFPYDKALSIIREESGRQFDPKILEAFFAAQEKILEVADRFSEKSEAMAAKSAQTAQP